jgi:hypothetical protein
MNIQPIYPVLLLAASIALSCTSVPTERDHSDLDTALSGQERRDAPIDTLLLEDDAWDIPVEHDEAVDLLFAEIDYDKYGINISPPSGMTYQEAKQSVSDDLSALKADGLGSGSDSVFTELLVNRIIPYWYGTTWSFDGYASVPGEGEIACGYFVSTTLAHVGVGINRYRLAQLAPLDEALWLAMDSSQVMVFSDLDYKANIAAMDSTLGNGIHFIGFDEGHVGYLLKRRDELFLIHSDPSMVAVRIEKVDESLFLANYVTLYVVPLSSNELLLSAWLEGQEL